MKADPNEGLSFIGGSNVMNLQVTNGGQRAVCVDKLRESWIGYELKMFN